MPLGAFGTHHDSSPALAKRNSNQMCPHTVPLRSALCLSEVSECRQDMLVTITIKEPAAEFDLVVLCSKSTVLDRRATKSGLFLRKSPRRGRAPTPPHSVCAPCTTLHNHLQAKSLKVMVNVVRSGTG